MKSAQKSLLQLRRAEARALSLVRGWQCTGRPGGGVHGVQRGALNLDGAQHAPKNHVQGKAAEVAAVERCAGRVAQVALSFCITCVLQCAELPQYFIRAYLW